MTEQQRQYLASKTCYILDSQADLEDQLAAHGIPLKLRKKITKALDLIFQVNQSCHTIADKDGTKK